MRTVLIFSGFIAYIFIFGALLSPWVYDLIQLGKGSQSLWGLFDYLANQAFGKISNRCFMIVAAIGVYPTFKAINCFNKKELGYDIPRKEFFKEAGKGLSFGLISLLVLAILLVVLNVRFIENDASIGKLTKAIFKMLPGAIVIGIIEETLFRGIILNSMSRTLKPLKAVLISSFIFATIHFLRNKTDGDFSNPQWYTGFSYLLTTLQNYTDPEFIGSYLTLFACGIFLSIVSLHYGNIARCMGIHIGWVLILSGLKKITDDTPDKDTSLWWMIGSYDKVTGYLAFAIITLSCFAYWFLLIRNKTTENKSE